jgi:hypothetical protein
VIRQARQPKDLEQKFFLKTAVLAGLLVVSVPSAVKSVIFRTSPQPLRLQQRAEDPPRQAFEQIFHPGQANESFQAEWSKINALKAENLNEILLQQTQPKPKQAAQKIELEPLVLHKDPALKAALLAENPEDSAALQSLKAPLRASGKIRLAEGMAAGDRSLRVKHVVDGRTQELGDINMKKGTYSIPLSSTEGVIRAEMLDETGTPIAGGEVRYGTSDILNQSEIVLSPENQLSLVTIPFNKVSQGTPEQGSAARPSHKNTLASTGIPSEHLALGLNLRDSSDPSGELTTSHISNDSWALVRSRASGQYQTLTLVSPKSRNFIPMFPEKVIRAFAGPHQSLEDYAGMMWVRVTYKDRELEDVELSIEGSDLKPVFGNGYYIFSDLNPGFYQLVARKQGRLLGHTNVVVDNGAVAVGEIQVPDQWAMVPLKTFDAFSGEPVPARADLQSLETSVFSEGETLVQLPRLNRLSYAYLFARDGEYLNCETLYNDQNSSLPVPMVKEVWVESLRKLRKINTFANTGVIIGFVGTGEYEIYLPQDENYAAENVVYFDSVGNLVASPVPGGGFIMFNVNAGVQAVTMVDKSTHLINTQLVPMDPGTHFILSFPN